MFSFYALFYCVSNAILWGEWGETKFSLQAKLDLKLGLSLAIFSIISINRNHFFPSSLQLALIQHNSTALTNKCWSEFPNQPQFRYSTMSCKLETPDDACSEILTSIRRSNIHFMIQDQKKTLEMWILWPIILPKTQ